jgi:hypothetical protein
MQVRVWCHTHVLLKLIFPCLELKQPFDVLLAVYQTGVNTDLNTLSPSHRMVWNIQHEFSDLF